MNYRDVVARFGSAMEVELNQNDHKLHWSNYSAKWLLNRLRQEVRELAKAVEADSRPERILSEAADVANFALMIADVCGGLPAVSSGEAGVMTCPKMPHDNPNSGYLHAADDDSPYSVDGLLYCGRCHYSCSADGRCGNPRRAS